MRLTTLTTHSHAIPPEIWIPLVVRTCISLLTRTFFVADEYYQSLEPAHHAVFGYGDLTWEWIAPQPIRSFLFPAVYVPVFYLLKLLRLDTTRALIWAPKLLAAAFAAVTDYSVYHLASAVLGQAYSSAALLLSLTSFFNVWSLSRSLSNSVETSFTVLALAYFPWEQGSARTLRPCLSVAAVACALRPTNAIIWAAFFLLYYLDGHETFLSLATAALPVAIPALVTLFAVDSIYFGRPILTALNFFHTNLNVSVFYGKSPWYFYFASLPLLLFTALPFALIGWYKAIRGSYGHEVRRLAILVCIPLAIYSSVGHKEWRFIHPILPILHVLTAKVLVDLYFTSRRGHAQSDAEKVKHEPFHGERSGSGSGLSSPTSPGASFARWASAANGTTAGVPHKLFVRKTHVTLLMLSLPLAIYAMRYHGRGQIGVMYYLRRIARSPGELNSVGFVMPSHSTPWQAYLHEPALEGGRLWALGSEPPLRHEKLSTYKDHTQIFYHDPIRYFQTFFPPTVNPSFPPSTRPMTPPGEAPPSLNEAYSGSLLLDWDDDQHPERGNNTRKAWEHEWPSHLVLFDALLHVRSGRHHHHWHRDEDESENESEDPRKNETVRGLLLKLGYVEVWTSGWNGFQPDKRKKGEVKVWRWSGVGNESEGNSTASTPTVLMGPEEERASLRPTRLLGLEALSWLWP